MKTFFYSLPLSLRLTLISVAFMVPIVTMLCLTMRGLNEDLSLTQLEQQGIQVVRPLINLHEAVPLHFQLNRRLIAGDRSVSGEMSLLETRIDSAMRSLDTAATRLFKVTEESANEEGTPQAPAAAIRLEWDNLKKQTYQSDRFARLAARHESILSQCRELLRRVGEESCLILDPSPRQSRAGSNGDLHHPDRSKAPILDHYFGQSGVSTGRGGAWPG